MNLPAMYPAFKNFMKVLLLPFSSFLSFHPNNQRKNVFILSFWKYSPSLLHHFLLLADYRFPLTALCRSPTIFFTASPTRKCTPILFRFSLFNSSWNLSLLLESMFIHMMLIILKIFRFSSILFCSLWNLHSYSFFIWTIYCSSSDALSTQAF